MLTELLVGATVYIVTGYTDMRKGIDGLAQIVEGSVGKDVYSKAVYLFCGRSNTKMKALVWDGDGFLLLYKRLDNGRYRWPRTECEAKQLTSQQLRWLMDGLEIEQKSAIKPGKNNITVANIKKRTESEITAVCISLVLRLRNADGGSFVYARLYAACTGR